MIRASIFSPVYGYLPRPSLVDFPGQVAGVFFLAGCNFSCGFCHNAALLRSPKETLSWDEVERACRRFQDDWVDAAVITGGEPTISPDLPELVQLLRGFGLKIKLDTNGSNPQLLEKLLPSLDYVAMDVKCSLERYPELAGFNDVNRITTSIALLKASRCRHEFRTTVLSTFHTDDEMKAVAALVRGAQRMVLQPFVPRVDLPDERFSNLPKTSTDRLREIQQLIFSCASEVVLSGEAAEPCSASRVVA